MTGNAQRRFCEHCQLHVHNLSAMSDRQRNIFVGETKGHACIAYVQGPGDTMITEGPLTRLLSLFRPVRAASIALLAAILPFWFSSCATRRTTYVNGKPVPQGQSGENKQTMHLGGMKKPPNSEITVGVPLPPDHKP